MEEFSIQMTVSMMWRMTVSRLSQTLRMAMDSIMEGEMALVAALWAQAALTSSRFEFDFLHFFFYFLNFGCMNSFVEPVGMKTTFCVSMLPSQFVLHIYLPVTQ
jgi:hypothetical protein